MGFRLLLYIHFPLLWVCPYITHKTTTVQIHQKKDYVSYQKIQCYITQV
jgi:hypothetical protein